MSHNFTCMDHTVWTCIDWTLIKGLYNYHNADRMIIFSSNDPYFLDERLGYYICKNHTVSHLLPAEPEVRKLSPEVICGNSSNLFIPKSKNDFVQIMNTVDTMNLSRPIRTRSQWTRPYTGAKYGRDFFGHGYRQIFVDFRPLKDFWQTMKE